MTFQRPYGPVLDSTLRGSRQVVANPVTKNATPPIQINRWVRNGLPPNAEYEDEKQAALNQAAMFRTKTCFQFSGRLIGSVPVSTAEDFWRTAFRSSSLAHAMIVSVVMLPPRTAYKDNGSYVQINLYKVTDESSIATTPGGEAMSYDFYYGPDPAPNVTPGWPMVHEVTKMIPLEPDTDYYVLIRRMEGADVCGVCALELASMTGNFGGYLAQNIGAHDPIVDRYRESQIELVQTIWESYGSPIIQWTARPGGGIGAGVAPNFDWKWTDTTTHINILDRDILGGDPGTNSTTVSANTPGWKPDMRNKARASQTDGVPCVLKVFGKWESGGGGAGGSIKLLDSTGATVVQLADEWGDGDDPEWKEIEFDLPAGYEKYDVHFAQSSGTLGISGEFFLWAVVVHPVG